MIALHSQTQLQFSKVPECNPDVVPPSISLVTPKTNKEVLPLDTYFVFAIKDMGK
ncbi:hypothetical protein KKG31_02875 [Patescibacteria group bacterium]|nr:hypothetical protein [Patescibacteria group bacterium]MBU1758105.1 hypothetical protein [Patescibacteria group bacterium]